MNIKEKQLATQKIHANDKTKSFSILLIFTLLAIIGLILIPYLSFQLSPKHELPKISIYYSWPEAPSQLIEKNVTSVYESRFATLPGLINILSESSLGRGYIQLEFKKETNLEQTRFLVSSLCKEIYHKLPSEVSRPSIVIDGTGKEGSGYFMALYFSGNMPLDKLTSIFKNKAFKELTKIKGIESVYDLGESEKKVQICYNKSLCNSLEITTEQIKNAIQNQFIRAELGAIYYTKNNEQIDVTINNANLFKTFQDIPIKKINSRLIKLGGIASLKLIEKEKDYNIRINGVNTLKILLIANKGINHLSLKKKVVDKAQSINSKLPLGCKLFVDDDTTVNLTTELNKLIYRTLISIGLLLIVIGVITRNRTYVIIIFVTIIVNLAISILVYYTLDIPIHLYTLSGIAISIGIITDNIIIMFEHLRKTQNKKVFLSLLASGLTVLASLSIIMILPQNQKVYFIDFAKTIAINIIVSLSIALWLSPSIYSQYKQFLASKKPNIKRKKKMINFKQFYYHFIVLILKRKTLLILFLIICFGFPVFMIPDKLNETTLFADLYNTTLGSRIYKKKIKPVTDIVFGGTLRIFSNEVYGNSQFSDNETPSINISLTNYDGGTKEQLNSLILEIEMYLIQFKQISKIESVLSSNKTANVKINIKSNQLKSNFPMILFGIIQNKLNTIGGVHSYLSFKNMSFNKSSYQNNNSCIEFYGYNYEELTRLIANFSDQLRQNNRITNILIMGQNGNEEQLSYSFNNYLMQNKNIDAMDLFNEMKTKGKEAETIGQFNIKGKIQRVSLVDGDVIKNDIWKIKEQTFKTIGLTSTEIKPGLLMEISKQKIDKNIVRYNQEYKIMLSYDFLGPNFYAEEILNENIKYINSKLPLGYYSKKQENNLGNKKSTSDYLALFIIIILIYVICVIIFNSLLQPLAIIFIIPWAFMGAFLSFYFFKVNFDEGGYASLLILSGIVVNFGILITNEFNNIKKTKFIKNPIKIYISAFGNKMFSVLLSMLSVCLGLLPFVFFQNGRFWYAFSVGTIGGVILSLVGLMIYLPLFLLKKEANKVI